MSKTEIIFCLVAVVSLFTAMGSYKKAKRLEDKSKIKIHRCIYNENPKCYERPCGYCDIRKECDFCCGSECDKCSAHKIEYIEGSSNNG